MKKVVKSSAKLVKKPQVKEVVPEEKVEVVDPRAAYNCGACKGEGLLANGTICAQCKGMGKL